MPHSSNNHASRNYHNDKMKLDAVRRTLGALLADVPWHLRRADMRAINNAAEVAKTYLMLLTPESFVADLTPQYWEVRSLAHQIQRAAQRAEESYLEQISGVPADWRRELTAAGRMAARP